MTWINDLGWPWTAITHFIASSIMYFGAYHMKPRRRVGTFANIRINLTSPETRDNGVSNAFLCTLVTFYRRNDLHQRTTTTYNTYVQWTGRFITHTANVLQQDAIPQKHVGWWLTVVWCLFSIKNSCEYRYKLYIARNWRPYFRTSHGQKPKNLRENRI